MNCQNISVSNGVGQASVLNLDKEGEYLSQLYFSSTRPRAESSIQGSMDEGWMMNVCVRERKREEKRGIGS